MSVNLLDVPAVFLLGLVFGMGPCTLTCLPYLGPVFLAREGGIYDSWKIIAPFSMGRLCSYGTLGALSGYAGASLDNMFRTPWVAALLGGATLFLGALIFWRSLQGRSGCGHSPVVGALQDHPLLPGGLFFVGVGMAATPCTPMASVLLAAAVSASVPSGLLLGVSFGIGAVLVPALVFGIGMAYFGRRIRQIMQLHRATLERASACLLIILGMETILG